MSWNYRVLQHSNDREQWYEIHEVYYDAAGEPELCTERAAIPGGETVEELREDLQLYTRALEQPVLEYATFERVNVSETAARPVVKAMQRIAREAVVSEFRKVLPFDGSPEAKLGEAIIEKTIEQLLMTAFNAALDGAMERLNAMKVQDSSAAEA